MLSPAATATPLAATASNHGDVLGWLLLAAILAAPLYLAACWIWPFAPCGRCKGLGKSRAPFGRAFRHCPRCDGSGLRLRIGRHVLNRLRDIRRAGSR